MMSRILSDYFRHFFRTTLCYLAVSLCAVGGMLIGGVFEKFRLVAVIATIYLGVTVIVYLIRVYAVAPSRFNKRLGELSDEQTEELLTEYADAKTTHTHHYMSSMVLFYSGYDIRLISYAEISGVAAKYSDLLLYVKGVEKPVKMDCSADGLCAVAAAYLRDRNSDIKILGSAERKE